jgi:hypothetical protein
MNKITYICIVVFFSIHNICEAQIQRVRLDFVSPDKYTRHLLLAFTPDDAATDGFDYGYDGANPDNFLNDLNWLIDEKRYIIQGVGAFHETKQYPLGLFLADSGEIEIALTALENFDSEIDVFVYDLLLDTYTKINVDNFKMSIDPGDYLNRFFISFMGVEEAITPVDEIEMPPIEEEQSTVEIKNTSIKYLNKTNEIFIQTPNVENIKQVHLINILGQIENSWYNLNTISINKIKIPVKNVSNGIYILQVETNSRTINKKVLVKQ